MSAVSGTNEATLRAIVAAVELELGADAVARGRTTRAPAGLPFPCALIAGANVRSVQDPPRYWTRTATVDVDLWDAAAEASPSDRVWLSEALAERVRNRLELAFADSTNELYLREGFAIESSALGSDLDVTPDGFARAFLVVSYDFRERGL